jgi:amino acid permease
MYVERKKRKEHIDFVKKRSSFIAILAFVYFKFVLGADLGHHVHKYLVLHLEQVVLLVKLLTELLNAQRFTAIRSIHVHVVSSRVPRIQVLACSI